MIAAAEEEAEASAAKHDKVIDKADHSKGKHYVSEKEKKKAKKIAKLTAEETPALAKAALDDSSYSLSTDHWEYYTTDAVVVSYDLTAAAGEEARRILKRKGEESRRNLKKKKKKGKKNKKTTTVAPTTTEAATTEAATTEATTAASSSSGTDATGTESTSTTTATTTPADPYDGVDSAEYEGADPSDSAEEDFEELVVDDSDVTLWTFAVYDRMANPQHGSLTPYVKAPLGELAGTWSFNVTDIPREALLFDGQYDLWVLSGSGDGIAGPVTFKVIEGEEAEEESR